MFDQGNNQQFVVAVQCLHEQVSNLRRCHVGFDDENRLQVFPGVREVAPNLGAQIGVSLPKLVQIVCDE